jgi:hypothetical protein
LRIRLFRSGRAFHRISLVWQCVIQKKHPAGIASQRSKDYHEKRIADNGFNRSPESAGANNQDTDPKGPVKGMRGIDQFHGHSLFVWTGLFEWQGLCKIAISFRQRQVMTGRNRVNRLDGSIKSGINIL